MEKRSLKISLDLLAESWTKGNIIDYEVIKGLPKGAKIIEASIEKTEGYLYMIVEGDFDTGEAGDSITVICQNRDNIFTGL